MFCTIHTYPCLAGVELFIDVQPLEGSQLVSLRDDYLVSNSARRIVDHNNVDTNVSEIVLRQASLYTTVDDMVQLDNQLFNKNDEAHEEVPEEAPKETNEDEPLEAGSLHAAGTIDYTNILNYAVFIAPS